MTRITLFLVLLLSSINSLATVVPGSRPPLKATEVYIPVGTTGKLISLQELSTISAKDFQQLTGKKLRFFNRISFKLAQRNLRRSIEKDGTISNKVVEKFRLIPGRDNSFHPGGFALGFFGGVFGVLIAYLINDQHWKARIKWAWIGMGVVLVAYLLLVLVIITSLTIY